MRLGITLLTDLPWAEARPRWEAAEAMGFDHAWTYDHLVWGGLPDSPWRTATPVLGAAAAVTSRIGLGTLVSSPNFRHPYLLFRDAQALDDVSGGRFLLGVGTGGDVDSRVLDAAPLTVRERVDRFEEFVRTLVALRTGDDVTLAGRWASLRDARTLPGPGRTPLLVAANGPRSVRLAAEVGDGWITTGPNSSDLEEWFDGLRRSAEVYDEAVGHDPEVAARPRYVVLDSAPHLAGTGRVALSSVDFFDELVGRVGDLGFTDAVTHWPRSVAPYAASERVLEQIAARR
ncbi:LLM class flavin-dependent oxidoreductase [Nocardioides sp. R-C-SC26]|uniref:LLM class flavin-dependent oxidoreductase n=1 Tax=Nocardioides sp. R-C-SC26 TaxID=2870414 RepID=UPI001E5E675F|nr:LLM class flavin-dependent oxidoreductase [Nocardioides sp. R-C-SC26]